jgi:hypothetical protein
MSGERLYDECIVAALRCESGAQHEARAERRQCLLSLAAIFRRLAGEAVDRGPGQPTPFVYKCM